MLDVQQGSAPAIVSITGVVLANAKNLRVDIVLRSGVVGERELRVDSM